MITNESKLVILNSPAVKFRKIDKKALERLEIDENKESWAKRWMTRRMRQVKRG